MDRSRREVRDTYDEIAAHFSQTREHAWPDVATFVETAPRVRRALDLGCGNGRHAELLADRADRVLGLDISRGLLAEARARAAGRGFDLDLLEGDAATVPLRDGVVGLAVYVAALHHLPDRETRVASLDELARVLGADGRALVSVWSTTHDAFDRTEGFDTTVDWTLPGGETVPRYYHIYDPDEFDADVAASDLRVERTYVSAGNCYAEVGGRGRPYSTN
ncbi:MAG: class I SAM-dependent methyltransferase [Haloarculaceae archaeon]